MLLLLCSLIFLICTVLLFARSLPTWWEYFLTWLDLRQLAEMPILRSSIWVFYSDNRIWNRKYCRLLASYCGSTYNALTRCGCDGPRREYSRRPTKPSGYNVKTMWSRSGAMAKSEKDRCFAHRPFSDTMDAWDSAFFG